MGLIALQKTSSTQCTIPLTDFVIQRFDTEQLYNITLYSFGDCRKLEKAKCES